MKKIYYSKFAFILVTVYLLFAGLLFYHSLTCSGFLCGIEIILVIYPAILLSSIVNPSFSLTNNTSFLFGTNFGFITLVLIHALIIYFIVLFINQLFNKRK